MADVIDLEEPRRIGATMRGLQADIRVVLSRMDGLERRMAIVEERLAEIETSGRDLREGLARLDRKFDMVIAAVSDALGRTREPPAAP